MSGGVAVVGSANVDLVYRVDRIPLPGETITAESLAVHPGGKGLNQAVAARRAGAPTGFVGAVGTDEYAELLLDVLMTEGIDAKGVRRVEVATGTAVVTLDASGENNIVILPGANAELTKLTREDAELIRSSAVLLCQLEVPDSVIVDALSAARSAGTTIVLNPAPVRSLPLSVLELVDVLIVNEHEARKVDLAELPVPCVVTTLGPAGATLAVHGHDPVHVAPRRTTAVDTTGAGDTFAGVLAAGISAGATYAAAAQRATIAASLSVETAGAVPSIPTRQAVDDVLRLKRAESR
jgi:ribokinase